MHITAKPSIENQQPTGTFIVLVLLAHPLDHQHRPHPAE
jgi:hypothetical protein